MGCIIFNYLSCAKNTVAVYSGSAEYGVWESAVGTEVFHALYEYYIVPVSFQRL